MAIDYNNFSNFSGGFKVTVANTPLDCRFVIEKEADIHNIPLPYVGCIIYAIEEDKLFVVKSLKDGFMMLATGEVVSNQPAGNKFVDWVPAPKALLGTYEEFKGGNCNCSFTFDSVQKLLDILYDINNGIDVKNKIDELANMLQNQGGGNTGGDSGDNDEGDDEVPTVDYKTEPWNPNAYTDKQIALKMTINNTGDVIGKYGGSSYYNLSIEGSTYTIEDITVNRNGQYEFYKIITLDNFPTKVYFSFGTYIEKVINMCNTSNVTAMQGMFNECRALTSLDLSNFNTSNVTDMNHMFYNCTALTALDLSNFNTYNVTNMQNMFKDCYNLTSLDLSNFNTSNVTKMWGMFDNCAALTSLDLSNFNTSNVTNMFGMFNKCRALTALDLSNFNTSNVTDMGNMFNGCLILELSNIIMNNCSQETITKITEAYNARR